MIEKHEPKSRRAVDILRHYMEDIVYGASDGIITTFCVVSGVEGSKLAPMVVIILGFVNLFGDGVSMGVSRILSIRAGASARNGSRGVIEPMYHGLFTFTAFFIFGLLPLLSFLIPAFSQHRFFVSCVLTGCTLFIVGALQIFVSKKQWLRGGVEMLLIGSVVAVIAYSVGYFVRSLY